VINPNTKWSASNSNTKRDLETKLNECIQNQDFEQAAKIRDEIKELQKNKGKIETLKKEMEIAIEKQDFERAIEIRDELKKIN
jgi:protein-arginine kinase activator protein McsA